MFYYLVTGIILIDGQRRQKINECVGHNTSNPNERVREAMAQTAVCQTSPKTTTLVYRWIEGPEITELPQDQLMRLLGAPTLPGLEAG